VTYLSEDDMRKSMNPNTPGLANLMLEALIEFTRGRFIYEANLNTLCPEVKPIGAEELMRKWWS
jgi:hypothetical protein